ncbi:histidine kinase dimerization/phosphoacceptor domain -containing protein [Deltaproteobacteria bacterium TL4]
MRIGTQEKDGLLFYVQINGLTAKETEEGAPQLRLSLTNISKRKRAEDQVKTTLKEKELLLKEIHHRVKNNMAVMASILELQFSSVETEKDLCPTLKK